MFRLICICCTLFATTSEAAPPRNPVISFVEVTEKVGLLKPLAGIMGHGGAWGDFDGDGRIDLFVGGFCDRTKDKYRPAAGPVPAQLFRNTPQGFVLVKQPAVTFYGRTSGAVFADLDNNGTLELYAANNARPNSRLSPGVRRDAQRRMSNLFRNDDGKFTDVSAASGACPDFLRSARNIGVFDYDLDGLLDLLVVEDRFLSRLGPPRTTLFRNLGGLKFQNVNRQVGLPEGILGLGLAVADVNEDGRPDFFVPHSNRFFLSTPQGKYREDAALNKLFAWKKIDGEDWPCGAAFGDLNRDGRLDLVLSIHFEKARNKVFLNMGVKAGVPQFRDVTEAVGLGQAVPQKCPHVEIQDFDNDGWPDIYMSAAWLDDSGKVTPLVYRNVGLRGGLPRFVPPRKIAGPMIYYPAGPSGDYDNDGRLDLFLINWFRDNRCRLMQNTSPKRHWLNVNVVGAKSNRMGIGAKVRVYAAGKAGNPAALLGFQEVSIGYGYASGQPAVCHFGLADVQRVDVNVTLPGGKQLKVRNVAADQSLTIKE